MSQPTHSFWRYLASLLVILLMHCALAFWALLWQVQPTPAATPPAAIMLELPPLPEPVVAPPPPPPPPPEPEPEPVEEPEPQVPEPEIVIEKPKPKPKPKPPQPKPPEPPPPQPPPETPPPPPVVSAPPPPAPQVVAARGPSEVEISWQARLLSHLARYKRYPEDARRRGVEGTVKMRFQVDAAGKVLSAEVIGPSGSASLDRATLSMIRRAQPLPKPPDELRSSNGVEVVAPFVYSLERTRR